MPIYNRGGKSLKVGDIGRFSVLRQHLLLPGERMTPRISGNVRLSGLRQQTSVYLHAQIDAFAAPLRWYQTNFPTYLQEGVGTAITIDTLSAGGWLTDFGKTSQMGIGKVTAAFSKWYAQHPIQIWNSWYRWPEDAKVSITSPPESFFADHGKPCVNLPSAPTRIHDAPSFDSDETDVPSATVLDVRDLAKMQARFATAAKTDWTSQERYLAFMKDVYGAQGSAEVDQIPTRLRSGAKLSVLPRDLYATDGSSLGEIMSINNFSVNHSWGDYVAKEHEIVCYVMLLRFAPVFAGAVAPGIYPGDLDYDTVQGDPVAMAGHKPDAIKAREIEDGDSSPIGHLPYGWQWREGHSHIDQTLRELGNFPLLDTPLLTAAAHRDASLIEPAFRSTALRHWFADLDFDIKVNSRIPEAGQSIMVGSGPSNVKKLKGNHPTGGWLE